MELKSKYCLTPTNCVEIKTEIPAWVTILIVGCSVLLLERMYYLLNN